MLHYPTVRVCLERSRDLYVCSGSCTYTTGNRQNGKENKVQNVLYRRKFTVYARLYITTSSFWWGIGGDHSQPEHQPENTVDSEGNFGAWSTGNLARGLPQLDKTVQVWGWQCVASIFVGQITREISRTSCRTMTSRVPPFAHAVYGESGDEKRGKMLRKDVLSAFRSSARFYPTINSGDRSC